MDLAYGAKRVMVLMKHTTKDGQPRIVKECMYPLTGKSCVNMVVTDLGVIDVTPEGLVLREIAPGWSAQEVIDLTEADLIIKEIPLFIKV